MSTVGNSANHTGMVAESSQAFGGSWTELKLELLAAYLEAYSIALKNQGFKKIYVDAFAGTGYREMIGEETETPALLEAEQEAERIFAGSATLSLKVKNPFDRYVFIEKSPRRMKELKRVQTEYPHLNIEFLCDDANRAIPELCRNTDWRENRAVIFLDPYGMAVDWKTMEAIAKTEAIDVWMLFPVGIGVNRLLRQRIEDIPASWRTKLDTIFGTDEWQKVFYKACSNALLFDDSEYKVQKVSDPVKVITRYYQERLESIFPKVAPNPRYLFNLKNSPMFILTFAVASRKKAAQDLAMKLAKNILEKPR